MPFLWLAVFTKMTSEAHGARRSTEPLDLRDLIETIPALVLCALADGSAEFANRAWQDYSGRPLQELTGSGWQSTIHPDDIAKFFHESTVALVSGKSIETESRLRRADGQYHWFSIRKTLAVSRSQNSEPSLRTLIACEDIEERKQEESARRYSEERHRLVVETATDAVISLDESGAILLANPATTRVFGYDPAELIGKPLTILMPELLRKLHEAGFKRYLATGQRHINWQGTELIGLRKNGKEFPVEVSFGELIKDGHRIFTGFLRDITERKQREEALRRSEGYLAEAQKLTHTGSWAVWVPQMENAQREAGQELAVLPRFGWNASYWSKEMYRIFGLDPDPTPPTYMEVVRRLHPEDARYYTSVVEQAIRDRTGFETDYRLLLPNGTTRYIHAVGHPVVNASGEVIELVGTAMDVTERKQAEEKIREQEVELRQILDAAPQHLSVLRSDGSHLYINQSSLDFLGLTLEEWQKRDIRELVHPDDAERVVPERKQALSSGSPLKIEARFLRYDGEYRWLFLYYKPLRDQLGRIPRWVVPAIDIDDRKRSEERLHLENVALREEIVKASMFEEIVGTSPALQAVIARVSKVAPTDSAVLITGETGTGKELIARAIHKRSRRSARPFVSINCGAISAGLVESVLFGHVKGAFTGAIANRDGRFKVADGGTILLDEVGDLPPETQVKLLRVLQEHEFEPIGSNKAVKVNVRILAATNRNLEEDVRTGKFRSDLLYRLNVFPIHVPPLRERLEDLPLLVAFLLQTFAQKLGKNVTQVLDGAMRRLVEYSWPGNVRELQNVIERGVILSPGNLLVLDREWPGTACLDSGGIISLIGDVASAPTAFGPAESIVSSAPSSSSTSSAVSPSLREAERRHIEAALAARNWVIEGEKGAARMLDVHPNTLRSRMKRLNIQRPCRVPADGAPAYGGTSSS